jgi:hypothetical protein
MRKAMEMEGPIEAELQDKVQIGQRPVGPDEKTPPEHWMDLSNPRVDKVSFGLWILFHGGANVPEDNASTPFSLLSEGAWKRGDAETAGKQASKTRFFIKSSFYHSEARYLLFRFQRGGVGHQGKPRQSAENLTKATI